MNKILMPKNREINQKVILYLLEKLGNKVEGKKKVMKLMFLLEHYDLSTKKLSSKQLLGNKFQIYYYGVFSQDIMNSVGELIESGQIVDGFPLRSKESTKISLDEGLKQRVDNIVQIFGNDSGYELEVETLKMLGIEPQEKGKYFGQSIENILKQTRFAN